MKFIKFVVDEEELLCYSIQALEEELFFLCVKNGFHPTEALRSNMEVETMRVRITLACTECKQRNYNLTKDKKTHPERMETNKYCKFCRKHTVHKETK